MYVQLKLQQDLANTQDVALKLEAENKEAVQQMQRMRADFRGLEEAHKKLAAEKVLARKDNDILKEAVVQLNTEREALRSRDSIDAAHKQEVQFMSFHGT